MLRRCVSTFAAVLCLVSLATAQGPGAGGAPSAKPVKPAVVVNLNTATTAELEALPGIGAKVAARIVEFRIKKGPFRKIEELMNVQGIGERSFLKLRPQLSVGSKADSARQQ